MGRLEPVAVAGRYAVFDAIASGGMATVHIGRLLASGGFTRTVAIKRLHRKHAEDPQFVEMFLDEARLVSQVRHVNVVPTLDLVTGDGEIFVVMEYVSGDSLWKLWNARASIGERLDPRIVVSVMSGVLNGLDAAHNAADDRGRPLHIVHRDVTPHNILVGVDGVARLIDFGVAKASHRVRGQTAAGEIRGKFAYLAPEQFMGDPVSPRTDVFAAGITLWEALTGKRLFRAASETETLTKVGYMEIEPPSRVHPELRVFDGVVMKALERDATRRFGTAFEMAEALHRVAPIAPPSEVGAWVRKDARAALAERSEMIARIETETAASTAGEIAGLFDRKIETTSTKRAAQDFMVTAFAAGSEAKNEAEAAPTIKPQPPNVQMSTMIQPTLASTMLSAADEPPASATLVDGPTAFKTLLQETPPTMEMATRNDFDPRAVALLNMGVPAAAPKHPDPMRSSRDESTAVKMRGPVPAPSDRHGTVRLVALTVAATALIIGATAFALRATNAPSSAAISVLPIPPVSPSPPASAPPPADARPVPLASNTIAAAPSAIPSSIPSASAVPTSVAVAPKPITSKPNRAAAAVTTARPKVEARGRLETSD